MSINFSNKPSKYLSIFTLTLTLSSFLFLGTTANAQNSATTSSANPAKIAAWCTKVVPAIDKTITKLTETKTKLATSLTNITTRENNLVSKANSSEASLINGNLTNYKANNSKLSTDIDKSIADFNATKKVDCGNSNGEFAASLKTARKGLEVIQSDRKTNRSFISQTLIPNNKEIRQDIRQNNKENRNLNNSETKKSEGNNSVANSQSAK